MSDSTSFCSVEGCEKPAKRGRRGMCGSHYHFRRLENNPLCSEHGCDRKSEKRGLCGSHYISMRKSESKEKCLLSECETPPVSRGLCNKHYKAARRGDIELPDIPRKAKLRGHCSVKDCKNVERTCGLCEKHYMRQIRHSRGECSESGCENIVSQRGLCTRHYWAAREDVNECDVASCDSTAIALGMCGAHYQRLRKGLELDPKIECSGCGSRITTGVMEDGSRVILTRRLCDPCATRRRPPLPITAAELVFRDGFDLSCKLCGECVLFNRSRPHPLSPSVDHIIPISRGGENTIENVQLAHLRCNKVKGNRIEREDAQMIA